MPFRAETTPVESDLLCESCGYLLNGLETHDASQCPECGERLETSLDPAGRKLSPIEQGWNLANFWATTRQVWLRKRKFFRETITRRESVEVTRFGQTHRWIAATLFGIAAAAHLAYMAETRLWLLKWSIVSVAMILVATPALTLLAAGLLHLVTRLAIIATAAESKFWGMRLPTNVLTRAMDFHAANYLPVAALAVLITVGYRVALAFGWLDALSGVPYLVTLCVAVVLGAVWLFESFVAAMRRIRLANY
jgi:predicted RNA-binding Zn-ribbon protein involved in translation (DUF1610 family)